MSIINRKFLAVLANPKAGANTSRAGLAVKLAQHLVAGRKHQLYAPGTFCGLDEAVSDIRQRCQDPVFVVGGDATVSHAITRLERECAAYPGSVMPRVFVIPMGSMNNLDSIINPGHPPWQEMVARIGAKIDDGLAFDEVEMATLRCDDALGFTAGWGFPVAFTKEYYAAKAGGPSGAVKTILRVILNEALIALRLRGRCRSLTVPLRSSISLFDGAERLLSPFDSHTLVIAGAIETLGLGCTALPDARRYPGKFMLRASQLSAMGFAARLRMVWAGLPLPLSFGGTADRAELEFGEPTSVMLDGEVLPPKREFRLTSGPRLKFVTG